jgi:hypothetical protein
MGKLKKTILSILISFLVLSIVSGFIVYNNQTNNSYVLSSRFFHPRGVQDTESTLQAIDQLNPKRVDWVYYDNDQILTEYKKRGLPFSLTLNPQLPDSSGYTTVKYRIIDYLGRCYTAPWMKEWKIRNPYWGCVNNPRFYKLFLDSSLFLAKKEPYALFVDDAIFNVRLARQKIGGCFCDFCRAKFVLQNRDFANQVAFDKLKISIRNQIKGNVKLSETEKINLSSYEKFQEQSVVVFFEKWQKEVKKSYPEMLFLTNNYNGEWNAIYRTFDGGIAEIQEEKINKKDLDQFY